jgi:hypothetical protein
MNPVDPSGDYEERYDSSAWISLGRRREISPIMIQFINIQIGLLLDPGRLRNHQVTARFLAHSKRQAPSAKRSTRMSLKDDEASEKECWSLATY